MVLALLFSKRSLLRILILFFTILVDLVVLGALAIARRADVALVALRTLHDFLLVFGLKNLRSLLLVQHLPFELFAVILLPSCFGIGSTYVYKILLLLLSRGWSHHQRESILGTYSDLLLRLM